MEQIKVQNQNDIDSTTKKLSDDLHAIKDQFIKNIVELNEIEKKNK